MSNFGLYKALDEVGIRYEKTKVGDRFVYENMSQNGFASQPCSTTNFWRDSIWVDPHLSLMLVPFGSL